LHFRCLTLLAIKILQVEKQKTAKKQNNAHPLAPNMHVIKSLRLNVSIILYLLIFLGGNSTSGLSCIVCIQGSLGKDSLQRLLFLWLCLLRRKRCWLGLILGRWDSLDRGIIGRFVRCLEQDYPLRFHLKESVSVS